MDYSVDEVGNITGVNQSGTQFNLSYDKLYRLTDVKAANNALIEGFTYDATGNRLSKTLGTAPVLNYSYAATDHKLSNAGDGARSFDANGNSTVIPGTGTISYDERNRLMGTSLRSGVKPNYTYSGVSNIYNARGERVQSQRTTFGPTQIMLFTYDEAGKLLASGNDKSADEIVYMDSIPVARVVGGVINPIEADHLGSPRVLQDAAGSSAVWTWNLLSNSTTGSNAFGEQVPSNSVTEFNLRFPGQYSDGNGLSYNNFRDYEAGTGRYVESDPIGLRGGVSTFGYVGALPLNLTDRFGLDSGFGTFVSCLLGPHPSDCAGSTPAGGEGRRGYGGVSPYSPVPKAMDPPTGLNCKFVCNVVGGVPCIPLAAATGSGTIGVASVGTFVGCRTIVYFTCGWICSPPTCGAVP